MHIGKRILLLIACGAAGVSLSCTRDGYRDMVYPDAQGQYTLKRVPEATPAPTAAPAGTPAAMPAATPTEQSNSTVVSGAPAGAPAVVPASPASPPPAPVATDPDLAAIQSLWPKLSPSDRSAVLDMTKHLATPRL